MRITSRTREWTIALWERLADGEWHSIPELLACVAANYPAGPAARKGYAYLSGAWRRGKQRHPDKQDLETIIRWGRKQFLYSRLRDWDAERRGPYGASEYRLRPASPPELEGGVRVNVRAWRAARAARERGPRVAG